MRVQAASAAICLEPFASIGTYSSLSWTNPTGERWYGFNVGIANTAAAVPEPATWALLVAGLGITGLLSRRRRRLAR